LVLYALVARPADRRLHAQTINAGSAAIRNLTRS
jgi:hypothetical protein